MDNERFSHHAPCPRCHSRDNLGVYVDGHKYCFGCKFYVPSPESIEQLRRKTMENNNNNVTLASIDSSGFTNAIPSKAMEWIKKYGITDNEIQHYGILWNANKDSLVFPIRDDHGIVYTNERYFGDNQNHPKYLTYGNKALNTVYLVNKNTPNSLVLVEDFISAIKVARFANCHPLFGSTVPANTLKWVCAWFKTIRIWLDMDKASQSLLEASKASQWVSNTRSIITPLDPKEYDNNSLILTLKKYEVLI